MITDAARVCTSQFLREDSRVSVSAQVQQPRRWNQPMTASAGEMQSDQPAPRDAQRDAGVSAPAGATARHEFVLLFGGTLSSADLAYLDEMLDTFGLGGTIVAGLDSDSEAALPTRLSGQASSDRARGEGEGSKLQLAAAVAERMGVKCHRLAMPIGIARTDEFLRTLQKLGKSPGKSRQGTERDRLVARLAGAGGRLANRRVAIYGEETDFVTGMVSFVLEAGMQPIVCASQASVLQLRRSLENLTPELHGRTLVLQAERFCDLETQIAGAHPDVLIANRDARSFARRVALPFVCAGRPLCHRDGDGPVLHIGYRGASELLDRLETALERRG